MLSFIECHKQVTARSSHSSKSDFLLSAAWCPEWAFLCWHTYCHHTILVAPLLGIDVQIVKFWCYSRGLFKCLFPKLTFRQTANIQLPGHRRSIPPTSLIHASDISMSLQKHKFISKYLPSPCNANLRVTCLSLLTDSWSSLRRSSKCNDNLGNDITYLWDCSNTLDSLMPQKEVQVLQDCWEFVK